MKKQPKAAKQQPKPGTLLETPPPARIPMLQEVPLSQALGTAPKPFVFTPQPPPPYIPNGSVVSFQHKTKGEIVGTLTRKNAKTWTVTLPDSSTWKVPPRLLTMRTDVVLPKAEPSAARTATALVHAWVKVNADLLYSLRSRWEDEKAYENPADYKAAVAKRLEPTGWALVSMQCAPFSFVVRVGKQGVRVNVGGSTISMKAVEA